MEGRASGVRSMVTAVAAVGGTQRGSVYGPSASCVLTSATGCEALVNTSDFIMSGAGATGAALLRVVLAEPTRQQLASPSI